MNFSPKRYLVQPPEWQAVKTFSEMHLLPAAENLGTTFSYPKHSVEQTNSQLQAAQLCSGYVGVSSSQNLGDTMTSRDWQEILNTTFATYYDPPSLASLLHIQSDSNHAVVEEGAILREFIGRLGGGAGSNGALPLSSGPAEGLQSSNFLAANGWKALDASADESLTGLEAGKGCIEMARSTSHRLTQAISNPEFSGRASRLSTIRDGVCVYLGQPIASLDVEEKNDVRSEASQTRASSLLSLNTLATQTPPLSSATADRTKDTRSWNITSRAAELNNRQEFCSDLKLTELERYNFSSRPSTTNVQLAEQRTSMEVDNKFVEIHLSTSADRSLNTEQNRNEQRFPACYGATLRKKRKSTLMEKSEDEYRLTSVSDVKKSAAEATNIKEQQLTESRKNIKEVRMKLEQTTSEHARNSASVPIEDSSKAPADPPKLDYIHVRARRGQATDSHSLAERVRREKISERMKFLQDLVPGCSKVTGKAVMLDEIINYVQSLQRQVEFLSMKLATVNPRSVDNVFSKEVLQPHDFPTESLGLAPELASIILQRQLTGAVGFDFLSAENGQLNTRLTTMTNAPMLNTFGDTISQTSSLWDCELQSVIQMGFGSNILPSIGSENIEKL